YTEPPSPPSPPLGPPFSMNFSRRKLIMPLPPSPAFTEIDTSSTNFMERLPPVGGQYESGESAQGLRVCRTSDRLPAATRIQKQKSPVARTGLFQQART